MKRLIEGCTLALAFLTIAPFKPHYSPAALRASLWFYPLAGLLTGGLMVVTAVAGAGLFPVYSLLTAVLVVIAEYLASNFLHLDGFCDCVDAFYFTKPGKDPRAILKDPHLGMYAAAWLVILLLLKTAIYFVIIDRGLLSALAAAPILAFIAVPLQVRALPSLFPDGLGHDLKPAVGVPVAVATPALAFLLSLIFVPPAAAFALTLLAILFTIPATALVRARLGGFNGDTLGFALEVLKLLLALAVLFLL